MHTFKKYNEKSQDNKNFNLQLNDAGIDFEKFPEDYKCFLKFSNGGGLDEVEFKFIPPLTIKTGHTAADIESIGCLSFYPLSNIYGLAEGLDSVTRSRHELVSVQVSEPALKIEDAEYIEMPWMHAMLIPFLEGLGNSHLCLSLIKEEFGVIRYWDGDFSMGGEQYLETQPKVASSFTSFLKLLIHQNGGYIENLSEIYEELVKKGFK